MPANLKWSTVDVELCNILEKCKKTTHIVCFYPCQLSCYKRNNNNERACEIVTILVFPLHAISLWFNPFSEFLYEDLIICTVPVSILRPVCISMLKLTAFHVFSHGWEVVVTKTTQLWVDWTKHNVLTMATYFLNC